MKRVYGLAGLWLAVSSAAVFGPGCYGRNCEGDTQTFGVLPSEGQMIDENSWESAPIDGRWLSYPRQRVWIFEIPALGGRKPVDVDVLVSAKQDQSRADHTQGSGNLVINTATANRITVRNDSCSDYFMRLYVRVRPFPDRAPGSSPTVSVDGGDDPDAGVADASDQ